MRPTMIQIAVKPTVPEVLPLVWDLYDRPGGGVGCCLHMVLDDGNVADGHVAECLEYAKENGHAECIALAELMLKMSRTQRAKLCARSYERIRNRRNHV